MKWQWLIFELAVIGFGIQQLVWLELDKRKRQRGRLEDGKGK
jgi:hypothetical protein